VQFSLLRFKNNSQARAGEKENRGEIPGGEGKEISLLQNIQTASQDHIKLFTPFEVTYYLRL
jgi:hypothetical protein